jgi:hypothetical protein
VKKLALPAALALVILAAAAGSSGPAFSLGWREDGVCNDVAAQNPGSPDGCQYDARELDCDDGVDNDSDEATDCADADCGWLAQCASVGEPCGDGFCTPGESCDSCPDDCGECPAGEPVDAGEPNELSPGGSTANPSPVSGGQPPAGEENTVTPGQLIGGLIGGGAPPDCVTGGDADGDGLSGCCDSEDCPNFSAYCAVESSCGNGKDDDCDGLQDSSEPLDPDCYVPDDIVCDDPSLTAALGDFLYAYTRAKADYEDALFLSGGQSSSQDALEDQMRVFNDMHAAWGGLQKFVDENGALSHCPELFAPPPPGSFTPEEPIGQLPEQYQQNSD